MKALVAALTLLAVAAHAQPLDREVAARFADLALSCVQKEYPNKIAHVLQSDADVKPPRELTPSFYGCFDWHSSVHGHWMLARLVRLEPDSHFASAARKVLAENLTASNLVRETTYLQGPGRASFERPYGLAWLLQLAAELRAWDDAQARSWLRSLKPLETATRNRVAEWLPKLSHPVRSGEHSQSAFALGLMHDWATVSRDSEFQRLLEERILAFYGKDTACPLAYEPSGEDFLSPCIAEADLVRRVLSPAEFAAWLGPFLPTIARDGSTDWLRPAVVTDPTDGKLVHLDGLNLSRAWMLDGIASALPDDDPRVASIRAVARRHGEAGIAAVSGAHYEGGHWLGSFATYYVTRRGIATPTQ
ncbi:MAG TPA: DUF2891 domain-containing protein [Thermoanaerobaculia bacterium]|nr:DUF2891 domain-containing protein [Thermoanaerobaculia bacterium]